MRYNVSQFLREGIGASRKYAIDAQVSQIDELNQDPVTVNGEIQMVRTPRGILVIGKLMARLQQSCRRCLDPFEQEVTMDVEEEFVPSIDLETGATLPIDDDTEEELIIDEQHTLDLTEVVWQYLVVAGSSQGLCKPGCKGLCATCGQNLNEVSCDCERDEIDPRFAKLADLLAGQD